MKKIISHRGNITGPCEELENKPEYILNALKKGFDVEVDVWLINNVLFLGHDKPQYKIELNFITKKGLWCHAKNLEAFQYMLKNNVHCFWHENEKCVLTSKNFIWCFPGIFLEGGITVILGKTNIIKQENILGICTDYPIDYLKEF